MDITGNTERTVNTFPVQKLSQSMKTEKWYKECIDYIIGESDLANDAAYPCELDIQTNYDLYNSIYNEKDLKYVTNPFDQEDGFPAKAQNYNLIRPKIDLLIGEQTKRPDNFRVCRTSEIASSEIQEQAKQMLMDYVQAQIMSQMGPEEQARYEEALQSGEIMPPEAIHRYLTKDYKDINEITAYHTLRYLNHKLNIPHEAMKGWTDLLIAGAEVFYVGVVNNEPYIEWVNAKDFKPILGQDTEYFHAAERCCRRMRMSISQVYDRFHDDMSERDLNDLLEIIQGKPTAGGWGPDKGKLDDWNPIKTKIYRNLPFNKITGDEVINVYHCCWRSYRKLGFITLMDPETGEILEFEVDESYKVTGQELSVEWKWVIEILEGYKIGDDLYLKMQPVEYQCLDDSLNSQYLPYTGTVYGNTNGPGKSLVSLMKPLQYMYIILWYRLELAIAKDRGKVLNMDPTQIPKSMGIDISKWLHYLGALGINFINPYEEGWDTPGREGGKPASFNQISAQDLSMANTINGYIDLLAKIEQMMNELSGITQQRLGAITANELVGNVEQAIVQSNNITEPLFYTHSQVRRHLLLMLLNTAKSVWGKSDKRYLHYVLDEGTRAFLEIAEDFPYEDFDIFITDSSKETAIIEQLKQFIQPAMQNGASLSDAAEILTMDNMSMIKNKLEEIEQERIEREQAMREQEAELQRELQQMENQIQEDKMLLEQAKLDLEKYKIDTDAEVRITVAEINAYRGKAELDQNNNGIPDPIEIADQAIAERRATAEIANTQLDMALKQREAEAKNELEKKKVEAQKKSDELKATIEKRKLAVKEKELKSNEKIQKMKDKAAMDREKLKAQTALKNKVVGEK